MLGAYENGQGSQVDRLTGLPNQERFNEELARQIEENPGGFAVLCADGDNLKAINDSLGHAAGDEMIVDIASTLRETLRHEVKGEERETDFISRAVFRLASKGDEFGIILADADTQEKADAAMERIEGAFAKKGIRVSIGGRPHRKDESAEELKHDVDQMMRDAKIGRLPDLSEDQEAHFVLSMHHLDEANIDPRDVEKYKQKYAGAITLKKTVEGNSDQAKPAGQPS